MVSCHTNGQSDLIDLLVVWENSLRQPVGMMYSLTWKARIFAKLAIIASVANANVSADSSTG